MFKLRLYIAGPTSNSAEAIANLGRLCRAELAGHHEIEVIDVLRHPHRGLADRVFLTPMLVKFAPGAECRIIGTLGAPEKVLHALGVDLDPVAA